MTSTTSPTVTLPTEVNVINVGLPLFKDSVLDQGANAVQVDWRIPGGGDANVVDSLGRLFGPHGKTIDDANSEVVRRLNEGVPMLTSVDRAGAVIPNFSGRQILHCGPAIAWENMVNPLQRSIQAVIVSEGWAQNVSDAAQMAASGEVTLLAANEYSTVVPMATAVGPSAPVYIVSNEAGSTVAYSTVNQGSGDVPWFGVDSDSAIERLRFLNDSVGPVLGEAIESKGPIDIFSLAAQGVAMGDDVHMRVQATTNLFLRDLLGPLVASTHDDAADVGFFLSGNHLMFLNIAMAAAKSLVMWAGEVQNSSVVTTMSRNGTTYGIRLPGHDDRWFLAPSPPVKDALYYPGQAPDTSAPDIGDSAVLELVGLGGPAAANSPAVAGFLGGRMSDAIAATRNMEQICVGESSRFRLPILDFVGTPVGVDVRRVVEQGITPAVNTGIVHISDGSGQVGAGVAYAPMECFVQAVADLDARLG